jgi:hypothetical protein
MTMSSVVLGEWAAPEWYCHEAAVIKMVYSTEQNMFLVNRFFYNATIDITTQHEAPLQLVMDIRGADTKNEFT